MTWKCTITSGGGTETDGGDFEIVETEKTLKFICVREPFFSNMMTNRKEHKEIKGLYVYTPLKINKQYSKRTPRKDGNYNAWRLSKNDCGMEYVGYFNNGHVARYWPDSDTWTVYPNQAGIPYYFEKI